MRKFDWFGFWVIVFYALIVISFLASYITNLVKLFKCDFESPWKDEVIHLLGVLIPPVSYITAWF